MVPLQGVTSPSLRGLRMAPRLEGAGLKGSDVIQLWVSLFSTADSIHISLELTSRPKNKKINKKISPLVNMIFFQFFLGTQCVFLTISSSKILKLPYKLSVFSTISLSAASSSAMCHSWNMLSRTCPPQHDTALGQDSKGAEVFWDMHFDWNQKSTCSFWR